MGLETQVNGMLAAMNARGGYSMSLVCTDQGLLVAAAGEAMEGEIVAGLTSLFDDIVLRAQRDLEIPRIDEVTLVDEQRGRLVVRPVLVPGETRFFLVTRVIGDATWRRNTTQLARELVPLLAPLGGEG